MAEEPRQSTETAPVPAPRTPGAPAEATPEQPQAGRSPRPRRSRGTGSAREGRRRGVVIVVAMFVAIALVVLGFFVYRGFTSRMGAARQVDRATQLIEDADSIVVQVDRVMREDITAELATEARGAAGRVAGAVGLLEEAKRMLEDSTSSLTDDERERADLLKATAEARLEMLSIAPGVLEQNAKAAGALPLAQDAWKQTLAADGFSDKAVASQRKLTKASVEQSRKLNEQAGAALRQARSGFESAEAAFTEAPFETYLEYLDARIKLNRLSLQSDEAWLKGDLARANTLIAEYNTADKQAVALAKKLPASPERAVLDAYQKVAGAQTDAYFDARDRALEADKRLREY